MQFLPPSPPSPAPSPARKRKAHSLTGVAGVLGTAPPLGVPLSGVTQFLPRSPSTSLHLPHHLHRLCRTPYAPGVGRRRGALSTHSTWLASTQLSGHTSLIFLHLKSDTVQSFDNLRPVILHELTALNACTASDCAGVVAGGFAAGWGVLTE